MAPVQEAMGREAQALISLRAPQSFGNIWMQIPESFINENAPAGSLPLYVGINQPSTSEVKNRIADADTDVYLKDGNYYVSITDYGEVVPTAITDQGFPNRMLHLNTGYHLSITGCVRCAKSCAAIF